jgi:hypothetical protein
MKAAYKYVVGLSILLAAFLTWLAIRSGVAPLVSAGAKPLPPGLPAAREIAMPVSGRSNPLPPKTQPLAAPRPPLAATRKRTEEEEKAFWKNGEYHLLLDLYGPLISRLRLEPREAADLVDLLQEVRLSLLDVAQVGRTEKLSAPESIAEAVEEAATFRDDRIRALLGPDRYAEFNTYRERLPQSITVHKLSDVLAAAEVPLTDAQAGSLVQLYLDKDTAMHRRLAGAIGLIQVNGVRLTDEMIRASAAVLAPNQMAYFEKLEEQQNIGYFEKLRQQQEEGK